MTVVSFSDRPFRPQPVSYSFQTQFMCEPLLEGLYGRRAGNYHLNES